MKKYILKKFDKAYDIIYNTRQDINYGGENAKNR